MIDKSLAAVTTLRLPFTPPYNWVKLIQFLAARTIPGVEAVGPANSYYRRTIQLDGRAGVVEVRPAESGDYLTAQVYFANAAWLNPIAERLTVLFDLNCNPAKISTHFQNDPYLATTASTLAGLRVPGAWDSFELAVRAILGQQISVQAARTLAGRIVQTYGVPLTLAELAPSLSAELELNRTFPTPQILAQADLSNLGIIGTRAKAINELAKALLAQPDLLTEYGDLDQAVASLQTLPGVGLWTAQYIAMRALHEPDAFPATDLVLLKAFAHLAHLGQAATARQLTQAAQAWRPWRAYAAMFLWNTTLPARK